MMKKQLGVVVAAAVVCLTVQANAVRASSLQIFTDRGAFAGDDLLDWGQLGVSSEDLPESFDAISDGGLVLTGSTEAGNAQLRDQGNGWGGNFAPGAHLVFTQATGPLTLEFDNPIFGVGTQFQANFFGPFAAQIDAYNGATFLGSVVNEFGDSDPSADNSAIFLGVLDLDGPNITSVVLTILGTADDRDFAINELSLRTEAEVPEPASLVLLGTGVLALARGARRRGRTRA